MSIYKSMTGYEAGDLKKNKKKKESLKDYLQKRLTISLKKLS